MFLVTLVSSLLTFSAQAQYVPACGQSYLLDSFNLGTSMGYTNLPLTVPNNRLIDRNCLYLGMQYGQNLRMHNCNDATDPKNTCMDTECGNQMRDGRVKGFQIDSVDSGTECYRTGYMLGLSRLRYVAREQDVSSQTASKEKVESSYLKACTDGYSEGYNDGKNGLTGTTPNSNPAAFCYDLGHFEWSMVGER